MPDWIVTLLEQWAVVTAAPIPFAIAIVGAAAVIWLAIGWSYRDILSKNAQIELQDLSAHLDKLKGATSEEAKAKIDDLERMVASTIGLRWEPLNEVEIAALSAKLMIFQKFAFRSCTKMPWGRS
jgi:hypothetical protein